MSASISKSPPPWNAANFVTTTVRHTIESRLCKIKSCLKALVFYVTKRDVHYVAVHLDLNITDCDMIMYHVFMHTLESRLTYDSHNESSTTLAAAAHTPIGPFLGRPISAVRHLSVK